MIMSYLPEPSIVENVFPSVHLVIFVVFFLKTIDLQKTIDTFLIIFSCVLVRTGMPSGNFQILSVLDPFQNFSVHQEDVFV